MDVTYDFDNPNDMLDLRIKYKDDITIVRMINKIEDLQDIIARLIVAMSEEDC